ncbi:MAG: hypothetical protein IH851_10585 [Armatimonadetes bacterium]|nr:hypothetical protein [Armatimonadota bacterium]
MIRKGFVAAILACLGMAATAGVQDDFKREGDAAARAKKDPLEGKAPPKLQVTNWMNTGGKELKLKDLKGKVVVLDFWGVW